MQKFKRSVLAFLFVCCVFVTLFYLCGGSLDGILYGHWPQSMTTRQTGWTRRSTRERFRDVAFDKTSDLC